MLKFSALAAVALIGTAIAAPVALADTQPRGHHAERHHDDRGHHDRGRGRGRGWNGPEGYFVVYERACPDLREDRRDARHDHGWRDRREDRRDRRVIDCPPGAWEYVPSRNERRMGRDGDRLRPTVAYLDRRTGRYFAETRWGEVPVEIQRSRGHRRGHHRGHDRGRDRHGHYRW